MLIVFMLAQMLAVSDADMDVRKYEDFGIGIFYHYMIISMRVCMNKFDAGGEDLNALSYGD